MLTIEAIQTRAETVSTVLEKILRSKASSAPERALKSGTYWRKTV